MAPKLSGQNSISGGVFFVSKSLLGIKGQKKLQKFAISSWKPRGHVRILIYRAWPIQYSQIDRRVVLLKKVLGMIFQLFFRSWCPSRLRCRDFSSIREHYWSCAPSICAMKRLRKFKWELRSLHISTAFLNSIVMKFFPLVVVNVKRF